MVSLAFVGKFNQLIFKIIGPKSAFKNMYERQLECELCWFYCLKKYLKQHIKISKLVLK